MAPSDPEESVCLLKLPRSKNKELSVAAQIASEISDGRILILPLVVAVHGFPATVSPTSKCNNCRTGRAQHDQTEHLGTAFPLHMSQNLVRRNSNETHVWNQQRRPESGVMPSAPVERYRVLMIARLDINEVERAV